MRDDFEDWERRSGRVDYGALITGLILVAFVILAAHYLITLTYTGHW